MGARQDKTRRALGKRHVAEALFLVLSCLSGAGAMVMASPAAPQFAGAPLKAGGATAKAPPVMTFRFVAFGDYQGGSSSVDGSDVILTNLKKEAGLPAPSFYLNTGDIQTLKLFGGKFPHGMLYPARGNNDSNAFWASVSKCPTNWNYCSFPYLNSHFVLLYSGDNKDGPEAPKVQFPLKSAKPNCLEPIHQTDWFFCDLQKASNNPDVENIFVVVHVPPLAYGGYNSNEHELNVLGPIFNAHPKLRAVLSGHNHFYQRLLKKGVNYLVIGGAGARLSDPSTPPPAEVKEQARKFHFAIFDVDGSKVTLSAIGYDKQAGFSPIETVELSCKSDDKRKVPCKPPLGLRTDTCLGGRWVTGTCVPPKCPLGYKCCEPDLEDPSHCLKCVKRTQPCP